MTAHMRCSCGWQARRDHGLLDPCPWCGGAVEFAPVPGPLLAEVLAERFGDDAVIPNNVPKPKWGRLPSDPGPYPRDPGAIGPEPPYHKGRTLEELLDE